MLGLKKLVFWMIVLTTGYYGLSLVQVHTSGDVIAYKRFAKAALEEDSHSMNQVADREMAAKVLSKSAKRKQPFKSARRLFTYYEVVSQNLSRDKTQSTLVVDQVTRVESQGGLGLWGDREVRVRHTARLEYKNHLWKVKEFRDPAMF